MQTIIHASNVTRRGEAGIVVAWPRRGVCWRYWGGERRAFLAHIPYRVCSVGWGGYDHNCPASVFFRGILNIIPFTGKV